MDDEKKQSGATSTHAVSVGIDSAETEDFDADNHDHTTTAQLGRSATFLALLGDSTDAEGTDDNSDSASDVSGYSSDENDNENNLDNDNDNNRSNEYSTSFNHSQTEDVGQLLVSSLLGRKQKHPWRGRSWYIKVYWFFMTNIIIRPRLFAIITLWRTVWPRALVIVDTATDIIVAIALFESGNSQFLFMLTCVIISFPLIMSWVASLRFVQRYLTTHLDQERERKFRRNKDKSRAGGSRRIKNPNNEARKCKTFWLDLLVALYIFPPFGAALVTIYELYLVLRDIYEGFYSFIFGYNILNYYDTNELSSLKKFRKVIEMFGESVVCIFEFCFCFCFLTCVVMCTVSSVFFVFFFLFSLFLVSISLHETNLFFWTRILFCLLL